MGLIAITKQEKVTGQILIPTAYERLTASRTVDRPTVQILTESSWLEPLMSLHLQVRNEMPRAQSHYLLPKNLDYFRDLLAGKDGVIFGVFSKGCLVSSMAFVHAKSFATAHIDGKITCPDPSGELAQFFGNGTVGVIQSLCVRNNYLGRGYSRALIDAGVAFCKEKTYSHLFAQVAAQNTLSWLRFLDHGFGIVASWKSGHRRFLLRWFPPAEKARLIKAARPPDRHSYSKNYSQMPAALSELSAKLKKGYIILLNNKEEKSRSLPFVFSPRPCDDCPDLD